MIMDNRNIRTGRIIPLEGYCDQPYIVKTDDGAWLMTVTTGAGVEGASGQHVVSRRSFDRGESWQDVLDISPPDLPESSYSVLYKTKYGRIYCFYNYNADNLRAVKADDPPYGGGLCCRVDTQGHFGFKYSDDHGKSWSDKYYDIPQRRFEVDRMNPYGGEILFFWNVGKPLELENEVYVPIYKIRAFGEGFMRYSEGALLHSDNIGSERDPERLNWETLPDGDIGIRASHEVSVISEEHSFVPLSDGSVFCVFRTVSGHPWCAYSRDKCHTFSQPELMRYANGRLMKHPRAANFIWKLDNGRYVYWFHNHGGQGYDDRNPAWLCGATEYPAEDGVRLAFTQPVPVLYDDDPMIRMSYPDFVVEDGEYYITETQKNVARVHHIDRELIEGLFRQNENSGRMAGDMSGAKSDSKSELKSGAKSDEECKSPALPIADRMPRLKPFSVRDNNSHDFHSISTDYSFTLSFSYEFGDESEVLFSTLVGSCGIELRWNADASRLELLCGDGQYLSCFWDDDLLLCRRGRHEIRIVFDGGVKAVYFVTDGIFCDGGERRQFGFTRFDRHMQSLNGLTSPSINKLSDLVYIEEIALYE